MKAATARNRRSAWHRHAFTCVATIIAILLAGDLAAAQVPSVPTSVPGSLIDVDDYILSDRLGITFIGFVDNNMGPERYRNALIIGAGWNRWPLYWDRVEVNPNHFDWAAYDELVATDIFHGLKINAILLGRPGFRQDGHSIANLYAPIFSDGNDSAGANAPINPDNPWAQFVYQAVTRYKPGGVLAQQRGFAAGEGVRAWEIWNEPDVPHFWTAGSDAYARLLKTAGHRHQDCRP